MNVTKAETNNAIIARLQNIRKHPNADRLQLATVLGATVIVGLEAKEDDVVIYFDSNLRLSHKYLYNNNLYSNKELNFDTTKKGYFGKNGRVKAQNFRGETSNGFVASLDSLTYILELAVSEKPWDLDVGDEFTHINGIEICTKFVMRSKDSVPKSAMFHKHWNTKQLMREIKRINKRTVCYIEEKIHGTSGRIGNVLCKTNRPCWKFWLPTEEWKVIGGTRRVDNTDYHIPTIRKEVERRIAPHLRKGEQVYFEIYGYDGAKKIQTDFSYDCRPGEFKVMLYRVTITTPDGYVVDLSREQVYRRAEELGLEKPHVFAKGYWKNNELEAMAIQYYEGTSALDTGTMREGVVIWFITGEGTWTCLKFKSQEFLKKESGHRDKGINDVEDEL
jgi:hypothetical protein